MIKTTITRAKDVKTISDIQELAKQNPTGLETLKAMFNWGLINFDEYTELRGTYMGLNFMKRGGLNA
jgi:hypothetical protein